jgi:molybdopterin synthase catalytic subunit
MITAYATEAAFDAVQLYQSFLDHETDQTGTVVLHHGHIKRPGKQVPHFSSVILKPLVSDVNAQLAALAHEAKDQFELNQVMIIHRLGVVGARDTVLLVIASGVTRDCCFNACSWLVDTIKQEEFISLTELA